MKLSEGKNIVSVVPEIEGMKKEGLRTSAVLTCTNCFSQDLYRKNARIIFGFEQTGASSAPSKGQPFIDLMFDVPAAKFSLSYHDRPRFFRTLFWSNIRLASATNQTLPDLSALTSGAISGFFGSNQAGNVNTVVQSFQTRLGIEQSVAPNLSVIAGIGATSPLDPTVSRNAYLIPWGTDGGVNSEFKRIFGPDEDYANLTHLILTNGDRDRFLRNWFVGGRLRYQLVPNNPIVYPAVFELTFGQDELLTNKLSGAIMKFDSLVPIPIRGLNFLYFGASFTTRLTRRVRTETLPFFLQPDLNTDIFANTNLIRNIHDVQEIVSGRDSFSFRFGVDLLQLIRGRDKSNDPPE